MAQKLVNLQFVVMGPEPPHDIVARFVITCPSCKEGQVRIDDFVIGYQRVHLGVRTISPNLEAAWLSNHKDLADPFRLPSCPECGVYFRMTEQTFERIRDSAEKYFSLKNTIASVHEQLTTRSE